MTQTDSGGLGGISRWRPPMWLGVLAVFVIGVVYLYLLGAIWLGGPFDAVDHTNYIAFLNFPQPFFFEPIYTVIGYTAHFILPPEVRFPAVFTFLLLTPLIVLIARLRLNVFRDSGSILFAAVLIKSFAVGFITQRLFIAEMLLTSLVSTSKDQVIHLRSLLLASGVHFASLVAIPLQWWFARTVRLRFLIVGLVSIVALYFLVTNVLSLRFGVYDYSRYLESDDFAFGAFTVFQGMFLVGLSVICLPRMFIKRAVFAVLFILLFKLLFAKLEVVSRIFQVFTDLFLVWSGRISSRAAYLAVLFCMAFAASQISVTPRSAEVLEIHLQAIGRAWSRVSGVLF